MSALRPFMTGMIDYAGLFPPAGQTMPEAVASYAEYLRGGDGDLLGRFVLPVTRLQEFNEAAALVLPKGESQRAWELSVVATADLAVAKASLLEFNCSHWHGSEHGNATIRSVEFPAREPADVAASAGILPDFFELFVEVPSHSQVAASIKAVASSGARAKIRTGGISPDAFPSAQAIIRFIMTCHEHNVSFKATAGLHHPLRSDYPLTYERNSARSTMFGFLNVFLASALIHSGGGETLAAMMLEESDPASIRVTDDAVAWRDQSLSTEILLATRTKLALSFGSCSFTEPVGEARHLGFL